MKNILVAALAFCALTAGTIDAQAQQKSLRALLGFTEGAINIGADFEMKQSSIHGIGGYFFFQTDDDDAGVAEVMAIGGNMPIHLLNDSNIDVYFAPGFGIAMIDTGAEDETTFGPSLKLGAEYRVSPTVKAGLQYSQYYNWMSDDAPSYGQYTSASATFAF